MPDLPEEAVQAVVGVLLERRLVPSRIWAEPYAREILEAAAPVLTARTRADERRKVAEEQREAGLVVVSAEDVEDAIDALAEREGVCFGAECSHELCVRARRLRAALPERTENA